MKQDINHRIKLNLQRLLDKQYDYPDIFNLSADWPGDGIGRIILALFSLYQAVETKKERNLILKRLHDLFVHVEAKTNQYHYFGEELDHIINEQQLSGNSWYLRGLIKYYEITQEEKYLAWIKAIIDHFLLKIDQFFDTYPLQNRNIKGGVSGEINNRLGNWLVSSDVGCAFILLDGITDAYRISQDERLNPVIRHMIEVFKKIDILSLHLQTHATLSATRGIMRFYQVTGDQQYFALAEHYFSLYLAEGMTYDYQNFNWFNQKDTWTEPCCIVDSLMLSQEFYLETNDSKYLRLFNKILVNALRTSQRSNGGAGCSSCTHDDQYEIKVSLYEAFFCCSMRLAEGLNAIKSFFVAKDVNHYEIRYSDSFKSKDLTLELDYYGSKEITITAASPLSLKIYLPAHIQIISSDIAYHIRECFLYVKIKKAGRYVIRYELPIMNNPFMTRGDLLLTKKNQDENYSDLLNSLNYSEEELRKITQHL